MPSFDSVTMAERKRPALDDSHTAAPPLKRQAVSINGASSGSAEDVPGRDDLDRYQKDAILRQMREYKREAQQLESQLADAVKRANEHDEHVRVVDAWFSQLLDEINLFKPLDQSSSPSSPSSSQFESSLLTSAPEVFEKYLSTRTDDIKNAINNVFANPPSVSPDVHELQQRLSKLLVTEKAQIVQLQALNSEKERLSDLLENASYRYMVAEKKLDRAKSAQVAKLEAQAIATARPEPQPEPEDDTQTGPQTNGDSDNTSNSAATENARKEAQAIADKRAEQLEALAADNKKLIDQLTNAQLRASNLSEDDFAKSGLFKAMKSQLEDLVKRANDMEGLNLKLREESKQLQTERTLYREEADTELRNTIMESESQLQRMESDLARVRHNRDELMADLARAKAQLEQGTVANDQAKELQDSFQARITLLEGQIQSVRSSQDMSPPNVADYSHEQLQTELLAVTRANRVLEEELRSMEVAWKKASTAGSKKFTDLLDAEGRCHRAAADKAKADQKYFAVMKYKEAREAEVRTLKATNAKSAEIISQLKDAEASCRSLVQNLEKQLAEAKDNASAIIGQQRTTQADLNEQKTASERLSAQVDELKKTIMSKDSTLTSALLARREAEIKAAQLEVHQEESKRSMESLRKKASGNQSEEVEMLRAIALCTICRTNFKNTAIKTCGHVFCQDCVETRVKERSRKCPNCGKMFGVSDYMRVTL